MKKFKVFFLIILITLTASLSGCIIDLSEKEQKHPPMKW